MAVITFNWRASVHKGLSRIDGTYAFKIPNLAGYTRIIDTKLQTNAAILGFLCDILGVFVIYSLNPVFIRGKSTAVAVVILQVLVTNYISSISACSATLLGLHDIPFRLTQNMDGFKRLMRALRRGNNHLIVEQVNRFHANLWQMKGYMHAILGLFDCVRGKLAYENHFDLHNRYAQRPIDRRNGVKVVRVTRPRGGLYRDFVIRRFDGQVNPLYARFVYLW